MKTHPIDLPYTLNRTAGPAALAVTLARAKESLRLSASDTTHDTELTTAIYAAMDQIESDTGYACINSTYTMSLDKFPFNDIADVIPLPIRPIQSITSLTYYDADNAQQTLATTVYELDAARRAVNLKYDQEWPETVYRRNGIVITLLVGFGSSDANVARIFQRALLLQVGRWFLNPDMEESESRDNAYEMIIKRYMRTSYP